MNEQNPRNTGVSWRNNFIELEKQYEALEAENVYLKHQVEAYKNLYPHLIPGFLEAMNEIGAYGEQKHGALSFQAMAQRGDYERHARVTDRAIRSHMYGHIDDYFNLRQLHDHFKTDKHTLAAIAFNAMMEYHFARLEEKEKCSSVIRWL